MMTKRAGRAAWAAACVLLLAALVAFNLPGTPAATREPAEPVWESDAPVGHEPGEQLADFILLTALRRRYPDAELAPLDDEYERQAHDAMVKRLSAT